MEKILVVDDLPDVRATLTGILKDEGFLVETAQNEKEAIEWFIKDSFDFAFVDIRLHGDGEDDLSGIGLAAILRDMSPETIFYVMTGFVPDKLYQRIVSVSGSILLEKSPEFFKQIRHVISEARKVIEESGHDTRRQSVPLTTNMQMHLESKVDETKLFLSYSPYRQAFVRSEGKHVSSTHTANVLQIDDEVYARRTARALQNQNTRREQVKLIGKDIWQDLIASHSEIWKQVNAAKYKSSTLKLQFAGPRHYLRLPMEFMHMTDTNDDYLVLRHPVTRFVYGVDTLRVPISRLFLGQKANIHILMIAANTIPKLPGVDKEISELFEYFNEQNKANVEVTILPTEEANIDRIREELRNPDYDIIHFAGHGWFEAESPEESSLSLMNDGELVQFRASEFSRLRNSNVRLVYLSSCWGAASGDQADLLDDDFLGLSDVIVHSGVPTVLGYRWPVSDEQAPQLAREFYEELLEHGHPDIALWKARQEIYARDPNDMTWLSPILIHQV